MTAYDESEEDEDDEEDIKRTGDDRILTAQYVILHFRNLLPMGSQSLPRFGSYARVLDRGNHPFSPAKSKTIRGVPHVLVYMIGVHGIVRLVAEQTGETKEVFEICPR